MPHPPVAETTADPDIWTAAGGETPRHFLEKAGFPSQSGVAAALCHHRPNRYDPFVGLNPWDTNLATRKDTRPVTSAPTRIEFSTSSRVCDSALPRPIVTLIGCLLGDHYARKDCSQTVSGVHFGSG
jgi:hypothetical protein